jgi:predicted ester cyclase
VPFEDNKAVVRRFFEACWNAGDLAALDACMAPGVLAHGPRGDASTVDRAWVRDMVTRWRSAFPDDRIVLEHVIAEGEFVAVNTRFTGTHRAVFAWFNYGPWPPTGKSIDVREMFVFRVAGGRMVEVWSAWDQLSLARQLGVSLPPVGTT